MADINGETKVTLTMTQFILGICVMLGGGSQSAGRAQQQARRRNAQSLRRRRTQGFMSAAEIVVSDVQRHGCNVIIRLL